MNNPRVLALASVPAVAGLAWHRYRRTLLDLGELSAQPPDLPGERREIVTPWGSVTYRWVPGDPARPAMVLIHGWGKTADSAWWPIITDCTPTLVVVDLPGHGKSRLDVPFSFDLAADAVARALAHSGVEQPVLVAHSMGGPVALTLIRRLGAAPFSGLVLLATSAYWVRPRLRVMMAIAPYAMAPRSPILVHTKRNELRDLPESASHIAWAYTRRPDRRILEGTARCLRQFDARAWAGLTLPTTTWVVAALDGVLAPDHQVASAEHFGADVVHFQAQHSLVVENAHAVVNLLERLPGAV